MPQAVLDPPPWARLEAHTRLETAAPRVVRMDVGPSPRRRGNESVGARLDPACDDPLHGLGNAEDEDRVRRAFGHRHLRITRAQQVEAGHVLQLSMHLPKTQNMNLFAVTAPFPPGRSLGVALDR